MEQVLFRDLGLIEYGDAWSYQENLFNKLIAQKKSNDPSVKKENYLMFCEHPHVYTLGKSGSQNNLLIDDAQLKKIKATYFKTNRGGDITYHGPGQIVCYPIIDLEQFKIGVKEYVYNLEQSVIETLKTYNIEASRLNGATGVWLDVEKKSARKICAVGVRTSRYVTMHGFAFNVNTDLNYFGYINPCGFIDKGVTSMKKELGKEINIEKIKNTLKNNISKVFGMELIPIF